MGKAFFSSLIDFTIKQVSLGGGCVKQEDSEWIIEGLQKLKEFSDVSENSFECLVECFQSFFDSASEIQVINAYEVASLGLESFSVLTYESLEPVKCFTKLTGAEYCEFNAYMLKRNIQHCRDEKSDFFITVDGIASPGLVNIQDKENGTITSCLDFMVIGRKLKEDLSDVDDPNHDLSRYIETPTRYLVKNSARSSSCPRLWVKFPKHK